MTAGRSRGIRQAARIFGPELAEGLDRFWTGLDPDFERAIIDHAYGTMYSRTVLPQGVRELCAVMALTVLDKQPQLAAHLKAALHCGARREEVAEVLMQSHLYAGIPVTMNAISTMRQVFAELDGARALTSAPASPRSGGPPRSWSPAAAARPGRSTRRSRPAARLRSPARSPAGSATAL